jgi:hypothetical protein
MHDYEKDVSKTDSTECFNYEFVYKMFWRNSELRRAKPKERNGDQENSEDQHGLG